MTTTVDRLAKALERAEERFEEANAIIRSLLNAANSAPYRQYDGEHLAKELGSVAANGKNTAIKLHRTFSGSDLKTAKDAVERYWPNRVSQ